MKTGIVKCGDRQVELSRFIFGASHLGSKLSKEESFQLLDLYYAAGGRTLETSRSSFDTAPFGASQSEKTIGEWIRAKGNSSEITVITKGGHPDIRDAHFSRLDRKNLEHDIMTSLAVLGTDKVAGFLLHRDDERVPVSDIMDVLHDIYLRGYADFIGVSNWTSERIAAANAYAQEKGLVRIAASSILWNIGKIAENNLHDDTQVHMSEKEYSQYLDNRIPVFAYSSQAVGYFSKYLAGQEFVRGRTKNMDTEENQARALRMGEICNQYKVNANAVCLIYIANNRVDGYPIFSCSSVAQMEEVLAAFDMNIPTPAFDYIING